jgi:hypothetical protein
VPQFRCAPQQESAIRQKPRSVSTVFALSIIALAAFAGGIGWFNAPPKVIDLAFEGPNDSSANPDQQTINSIRKVGDLYVVSYRGDYQQRIEWQNKWHLQKAAEIPSAARCSLFAAHTAKGDSVFGRNLDRRGEAPVLIQFAGPGKYRSFGFSPFSECGMSGVFGNPRPNEYDRNKFLFSLPFYVTDGMNEKGLAIGTAGAPPRRVAHDATRKPMFVLLFVRHVLDDCSNVAEVAQLARTIAPYDKSMDTISHHFLAVDANGDWLVIDYPDGKPRLTRGTGWQVRTNEFIDGMKADEGSVDPTSPRRFRNLSKELGAGLPKSDLDAMKLLRNVHNYTAWSVIYNTKTKEGLIAARENYRTQYRFRFSPMHTN